MQPRGMNMNNMGPGNSSEYEKPRSQRMQFAPDLEIKPFVTLSEYAQLKAKNEAIYKKLQTLEQDMKHIRRSMADYDPQTEEEKKQVAAYKKLEREDHNLPKFYFHDISLGFDYFGDVYTNRGQDKYVEVVDPRAIALCKLETQRYE